MSVIGRLDTESARWYVDPLDPDVRYESVTTILSRAESLPWLTQWAAKLAAEYVAANLDELIDLHNGPGGPAAVIAVVKEQARIRRELKARIGDHQHDVMEALVLDLPIPAVPEDLVGVEIDGERVDHDEISDGVLNFLSDFDVRPLMAEATVASVIHGYAGTLDLIGDFGRSPVPGAGRALVDLKTGMLKNHARAQLAAYRRCDEVWLDQLGNRAPMPQVDFAAVLHVRREHARGYKLVPAFATPAQEDDAFAWFLACQRVLRHQESQAKIPRTRWYPPLPDGTQPPPLLEDVEHPAFRCRNVLLRAGMRSLADLQHFTAAELLALDGFGARSLDVVVEILTLHGLALAEVPAETPQVSV